MFLLARLVFVGLGLLFGCLEFGCLFNLVVFVYLLLLCYYLCVYEFLRELGFSVVIFVWYWLVALVVVWVVWICCFVTGWVLCVCVGFVVI